MELRQRPDDTPETVRRRIGIYERQTAPLVDFYRQRGQLREVNGAGAVETVYAALREALDGHAAGH
jgi:adenylate kinase